MSSPQQQMSPKLNCQSTIDQKKAKKRELDRICQRRKRRKDRDNLKTLEDRVKFLQQQKDDVLLKALLLEKEQNEERATRRKRRLLQMQALLEADLAELNTHDEETTVIRNPNSSAEVNSTVIPFEANQSGQSIPSIDMEDAFSSLNPPEPESIEQEWLMQNVDLDQPFDTLALEPITNYGRNNSTWKRIEQLIFQAQQETSSHRETQSTGLDIHIIITAITIGWASVAQVLPLDSRGRCLRKLDEDYFMPNYGKVERLAVLLIASQMFKLDQPFSATSNWIDIIPPFVKPRPSQLIFPHSVIADCYVWPGFRERLCLCNNYHTDTFLQETYSMFRFLWPHNIKDAFDLNPQTNLYQLSKGFLTRFQDLRCWTMDSDFLGKYPDFQGDIPVSNPRPIHLSLTTTELHCYYFINQHSEDQEEESLLEGPCGGAWPDLEFDQ